MAKANYHQIRRQKELARKTRQQEKQQKRLAGKADEPGTLESTAVESTSAELTAAGPTLAGLMATGAGTPASVDEPVAGNTGSGDDPDSTRS